jgi:hypothetical protein
MKNKTIKINVELPFNDIMKAIEGFTIEQKLQILKQLEKDTFKERFYALVNELKDNDLTMDEITKEVEAVRAARHNKKIKEQKLNHFIRTAPKDVSITDNEIMEEIYASRKKR